MKDQFLDKAFMERKTRYLKISLIIEILFGLGIGGYMGLFLGVMATDFPKSTEVDFAVGGLIGFCFFALPMVVLPTLSIRELIRFSKKKKTIINYINSVSLLFFAFFLPVSALLFILAIWQIYMLMQMKTVSEEKT